MKDIDNLVQILTTSYKPDEQSDFPFELDPACQKSHFRESGEHTQPKDSLPSLGNRCGGSEGANMEIFSILTLLIFSK